MGACVSVRNTNISLSATKERSLTARHAAINIGSDSHEPSARKNFASAKLFSAFRNRTVNQPTLQGLSSRVRDGSIVPRHYHELGRSRGTLGKPPYTSAGDGAGDGNATMRFSKLPALSVVTVCRDFQATHPGLKTPDRAATDHLSHSCEAFRQLKGGGRERNCPR